MRTLLAACLAALSLLLPVQASAKAAAGAREGFSEGNRLYQEGRFGEAIDAYERVLKLGVTAMALEYNLGNACLKANRLGPAILHYRRALALAPTYENATINLEYARSLTRDVKSEPGGPSPFRRLAAIRLGPERAAVLFLIGVVFFCTVGVLRLRIWRGKGWTSWLQGSLGAVALLLLAAVVFEWMLLERRKEGVVMPAEIEVRTGPAESYTVSFRLHEGTEVDILRDAGGWREVRVSPELQGWVPGDAVTGI